MRVTHRSALVTCQIPELDGKVADGGAVGAGCREQCADVGFDEFIGEIATGTEV